MGEESGAQLRIVAVAGDGAHLVQVRMRVRVRVRVQVRMRVQVQTHHELLASRPPGVGCGAA